MNQRYEFETVEVFAKDDLFVIKAPDFGGETQSPISEVMKSLPNMLQEKQHGGWEVYGVAQISKTIVFMVRRPAGPQILLPTGLAFR